MEEAVNRTLSPLYYGIGSPTAYASLNRLHAAVKEKGLSRRVVRHWLLQQDAYTLHRKANKNGGVRRKVFVRNIDEQWSMDLCDMGNVASENDGTRYILTVIDVLSKFAWVAPSKNKSGPVVANAFENILSQTDRRPKRVESDRGKEFFNQSFKTVLEDIPAEHFSTTSANKACVVERFNRTLKGLIYRYFSHKRTLRWIDNLNMLVRTYNTRHHRSIGMAPATVDKSVEGIVFDKLYGKKPDKKYVLHAGDLVRISKVKKTFEKGYLPSYTEEIFKVVKVRHHTEPRTYTIADLMDEKIEGTFDDNELKRVMKKDNIWRVQEVLKRNKQGQYFVKWAGFPDKFNSWVNSIE